MSNMPSWSISDKETEQFLPKTGFIAKYVKYQRSVSDAPLIFHYATALSILAVSSANCDVQVVGTGGKTYELPIILWIGLIASSGDRKSAAMGRGVKLLNRYRLATPDKAAILPSEGSQEAWHHFLVQYPNSLLFRDELALLFDMKKSGYLSHIRSWLLELYSGETRIRVTRPRTGQRRGGNGGGDQDGPEEGGEGPPPTNGSNDDEVITSIIDRPRVNILGGIPPETLRDKSEAGDWSSGFLARFIFLGGWRDEWLEAPWNDERLETSLCQWLHSVAYPSRGMIKIHEKENSMITKWLWENVEQPRRKGGEDRAIYSSQARFQEHAYKIAALYAMSRQTSSQAADAGKIWVDHSDVSLVLKFLDVLQEKSRPLFEMSRVNQGYTEAEKILEFISTQEGPVAFKDLRSKFSCFNNKVLKMHLDGLVSADVLLEQKIKTGKAGRKPIYYTLITDDSAKIAELMVKMVNKRYSNLPFITDATSRNS